MTTTSPPPAITLVQHANYDDNLALYRDGQRVWEGNQWNLEDGLVAAGIELVTIEYVSYWDFGGAPDEYPDSLATVRQDEEEVKRRVWIAALRLDYDPVTRTFFDEEGVRVEPDPDQREVWVAAVREQMGRERGR